MSTKRAGIIIIFLIALLLRLSMIGVWYGTERGLHLSSDTTGYYEIAQNLIQGQGFVQSGSPLRRAPVFPLLLALVLKLHLFPLGFQLFQALIGAATSIVLFVLGREIFGTPVGLVAAGIQGFDYLSVRQTAAIMPETVLVFLTLLSTRLIFQAVKENSLKKAALGGVLAGLTILTKEVFTVYFILISLWILLVQGFWGRGARLAGAFLIFFILTLAPWLIRNHRISREWFLITANSGHVFYLGNNPSVQNRMVGEEWDFYYDSWFPAKDPSLPPLFTPEADRYLFRLGLDYVRTHPFQFLERTGKKFLRFWYPFYQESPLLVKGLTVLCYVPILVFGLVGIFFSIARSWKGFLPLYGPIFFLTAAHSVTISSIRYRFPVMPFMMLFAAWTIYSLWERCAPRKGG